MYCASALYKNLLRAALVACLAFAVVPAVEIVHAELEARAGVVEAAFILKFADFIEWPEGASDDTHFIISVLGDSVVFDHLQEVAADKTILGKPLKVRKLSQSREVENPDILFLGKGPGSDVSGVVSRLRKKPILIVADVPGAAEDGAMINFFIQENRVRFEVNKSSIEQAGLKASFRLLQVGVPVGGTVGADQ